MEEQIGIINKEKYQEIIEKKIEDKKWAERFLKTEDWKKLASFISLEFPTTSPYSFESIQDVKVQGAYIKGLTFPEKLLLSLIVEGKEAEDELKLNPSAE